ncbi:MAG: peptidoglycan editing factor PgeF [Clostridiales bacterium]|nr:peptidoglycan editing factor PgeF [Clostridiales bacterium]
MDSMGFERFRDELIYDYSTKHGGVSEGVFASMNLSLATGDEPARIKENFRLWCGGLGVDPSALVMVGQTHTTNVIRVDERNRGEGLTRERIHDVDGMITDRPGVALVTSHADCVPLYFYDPVHKVIGLAHAGWRGTVDGMAAVMIRRLAEEFGSAPADLYTRIGPCISQTYFECDRDVIDAVMAMPLWGAQEGVPVPGYDRCLPEEICYYDAAAGKYHVSLARLDREVMLQAGVPADHIDMADTCTYARGDLYFSHRRQGMQRGGQAALLMMKE